MGNYAVLPTDDADLETSYTAQNVTDVATDDGTRVAQSANSGEYAIHQFKNYLVSNSGTLTWDGQSNIAPTASTVYLEIYNYNGAQWESADSDNTTAADTDFRLSKYFASFTNYTSPYGYITCRVYQLAP